MSNTISRLTKLEKESNPYPRDFPGRETIINVLNCHVWKNNPQGSISLVFTDPNKIFKIAGRIVSRRDHGNNIFFDIFDQTGEIQLHYIYDPSFVSGPEPEWNDVRRAISETDLGDMVGVEGTLTTSPRGEPLLLVSKWTTLAKALKEPPDKKNGVKSPEMKYRHRELDLMSSKESRDLFKTRARVVAEIRKYLNDRDFVEIECPVLQPIYGGATARPFTTKHNALNQDFFLSISSELYLKRALVGGFDRVYSFSRCFRNEGISPSHNPEFTNLEIFETCKTADDMQVFTDKFLEHIAHSIGSLLPVHQEFKKNLQSSDWPLSRKYHEYMSDIIKEEGRQTNIYADAWELFIDGMEIASGASDLNAPREQAARLKKSEEFNAQFDDGPLCIIYDPYDQNYIEALEQGALPWAGVGIGIDRLMMLLTGKKNIRDVIMFPLLKKEN